MERHIDETAGRVNGKHGEASWTPIRYAHSRSALVGLYRSADVALVTPLRDGMNLVAKEYVASQDPEDPGVLILSRFAGAAVECEAAAQGAASGNPQQKAPSRKSTSWKRTPRPQLQNSPASQRRMPRKHSARWPKRALRKPKKRTRK